MKQELIMDIEMSHAQKHKYQILSYIWFLGKENKKDMKIKKDY
jgi:hypothetical protein